MNDTMQAPAADAPGAAQNQMQMQAPGQAAPPTAEDGTGPTQDPGVSFQTFYDNLSGQGTWIQTNEYGYVWQPQVNDPNWAPYTEGHWVYTDDGWTWDSDEAFGWATYHYGRWVNLENTGWVWVPGYTWGPAWVSWRYGDGNAGWAPLPPDSFAGVDYASEGVGADYGYHIGGDCDGYYGIGPAIYIFLPVNCLGYRHYHGCYRDRHDNFGLINHTTNLTNINVNHRGPNGGSGRFRHVTTGGPQLAQVNAASTTPVPHVNLVQASHPGASTLTGSSLEIYAPHVHPSPATARPTQVGASVGATRINRGTDIGQPLAVNARLAPAPATDAQVQAAHLAVSHAPSNAKVLTDASSVRPVFSAPITSLKPITHETVLSSAPPQPGRNYAPAPGAVYGSATSPSIYGPVHTPARGPSQNYGEASQTPAYGPGSTQAPAAGHPYMPGRVYNPSSGLVPRYSPTAAGSEGAPPVSHPSGHGQGSASEASSAPASSAPAESHQSSAPSGGGGHAAPSGATSAPATSGTSSGSAGGTSSGSGAGSSGTGRSH